MLKSFLTGAIGGAVAVWWLKDPIIARLDARTRPMRRTTARRLHAVADTIEHGVGEEPRDAAPPSIAHAS